MKLWAILPELAVALACLLGVPLAGLTRRRARWAPWALAAVALATAAGLTVRMLGRPPEEVFHGHYAVDGFGHVFKLLALLGAGLTLAVFASYFRGQERGVHAPVALLFATLAAMLLASTVDLGLIFLFLQMLGFAGYVLVALVRNDARALEAGLKFFLYGAVALAVMGYGLTLLYGLTGELELRAVGRALATADPAWVALALILILVGFGFEITLVPFHVWSPDVFAGTTAPVAAFVSVVPKVGGLAALLRVLLHALPGALAAWPVVLALAAAVTMTFGNLAALRQRRLKRLLAYSSIAQAGYLLLGVAPAAATQGTAAVAYYLAAYAFMNVGAFTVVAQVERAYGTDSFEAFRGLGRRAPGAAALLTLYLFSLAGVPPLAGFAGKVLLLEAALDGGLVWLAVVAAVNWVLALYYYVAVVAEVYLKRPLHELPISAGLGYAAAHGMSLAGTLALGVLPGPFLALADLAGRMLG